jgi:hypothetical protein
MNKTYRKIIALHIKSSMNIKEFTSVVGQE